MRPPICEVCDEKFLDDELNAPGNGGLVEFKPSAEDKEVIARMQVKGWVGHPPNMGWFCREHIEDARALRHIPLRDALKEIRRKLERG